MRKLSVGLLVVSFFLGFAVVGRAAGGKRELRRATPPKKWEKLVESQFVTDAFELLEGERPKDFGSRGGGAVVEGGKPPKKVDAEQSAGNGDFDRRDMMKKLEGAENSLAEVMSSEKVFKAGGSKIDQTTDLVIMMGKTLFSNDPDYADDDTYLKHAQDMTNFAKQLKNLSKKEDYASASAVFGKMKTSCNSCHEGFR